MSSFPCRHGPVAYLNPAADSPTKLRAAQAQAMLAAAAAASQPSHTSTAASSALSISAANAAMVAVARGQPNFPAAFAAAASAGSSRQAAEPLVRYVPYPGGPAAAASQHVRDAAVVYGRGQVCVLLNFLEQSNQFSNASATLVPRRNPRDAIAPINPKPRRFPLNPFQDFCYSDPILRFFRRFGREEKLEKSAIRKGYQSLSFESLDQLSFGNQLF